MLIVVGKGGLSSDLLDKFPYSCRLGADGDATDFLSPSFLIVNVDNFGNFSIQLRNARAGHVASAMSVAQFGRFDGLSRWPVRFKVFPSASRDVVVRSLVHDVPESLLAADGITWRLELSKIFFALFSEVFPVRFLEARETSSGVVDRRVLFDGKTDADREVVTGHLSRDGPLGNGGKVASSQRDVREVSEPFAGTTQYNPVGINDFFCNVIALCVCVYSCVPVLVAGVYVSKQQSFLESGQVLKLRFVPGVA